VKLREYIKQEHFRSPGHEAMLNVMVTSSWFLSELAAVMAPFGLTPAQFNVLRILKGSSPQMLTCSEVGSRLLDRTPDVTRLLNRLENNGLIVRERADHDRRIVYVGISDRGRELLDRINPAVESRQEALMSALNVDEQQLLAKLLDRLRSSEEAEHPSENGAEYSNESRRNERAASG
jgi:DNA-binding MarR family transcriptional regulator